MDVVLDPGTGTLRPPQPARSRSRRTQRAQGRSRPPPQATRRPDMQETGSATTDRPTIGHLSVEFTRSGDERAMSAVERSIHRRSPPNSYRLTPIRCNPPPSGGEGCGLLPGPDDLLAA